MHEFTSFTLYSQRLIAGLRGYLKSQRQKSLLNVLNALPMTPQAILQASLYHDEYSNMGSRLQYLGKLENSITKRKTSYILSSLSPS